MTTFYCQEDTMAMAKWWFRFARLLLPSGDGGGDCNMRTGMTWESEIASEPVRARASTKFPEIPISGFAHAKISLGYLSTQRAYSAITDVRTETKSPWRRSRRVAVRKCEGGEGEQWWDRAQ